MKKYSRWIFLIVAGVIIYGLIFNGPMPSKSDVEAQIKTNIPIGSSKEKVITFLKANGYEYFAIYKPNDPIDKDNRINALSRKTYMFFLAEGKVDLIFHFDQENKLISYKVDNAWTFL